MAEESLIVRLDAKTQALDAKLQSTNEKLDKLSGTTENTDSVNSKGPCLHLLDVLAVSF